jgi:Zinc finger, C3HC4 type (RING finger)
MRRRSTGAEVIAATAGQDNWQTWAGRSHGSAGFEFLDIFRGAKRQFNRKFVWGIPPAGTACPVCFTVPEEKSEWHVTSSCGHAVCRDCLQGYASSLVRDAGHHGPLRCPVCPMPLRPKDAISALNDPELLRLWDAKIRDEVLRALPGYRHCPRCNGANNGDDDDKSNHDTPSTILKGGGFVTPECLAPINKERERQALLWLDTFIMKPQAVMVAYFAWLFLYLRDPSSSVYVDIINTSVVPLFLLRRIWLVGRCIVAFEARKKLFAPITVECPCCDKSFILNAESELGNNVIADEATKKWIGSHSRPCPSCSCPIEKSDGCNHMVVCL